MFKSKLFWYPFTLSAVLVWIFIIYGFLNPISDKGLYYTWLILAIMFLAGHLAEIRKGLPVGREAGHSTARIVVLTYLFGIAYWYPVKHGIYKK